MRRGRQRDDAGRKRTQTKGIFCIEGIWDPDLRTPSSVEPLLDLLRRHRVALALAAYYTMPGPDRLLRGPDPVTADFGYIRFLGHHRQMDKLVRQALA